MKKKVAAWLESLLDTSDVKPVKVTIGSKTWEGAVYTVDDEQKFYLVGKLPNRYGKVCYNINEIAEVVKPWNYEWFVGGYIDNYEELGPEYQKYHPFGNHWLLVPWNIPGDPKSKIDDHENTPHTRVHIELEIG